MFRKTMQEFLKQTIQEAGAIAKGYFDNGVKSIKTKSSVGDLVTEADVAVSEFIVEKIKKAYPDHTIFSEEVGEKINAPIQNDYCLNIPVLTYHRIQPQSVAIERGQTAGSVDNGIFDQQMAYLMSNGYHTITAEDLVSALKNHLELPSKSIVITLDDGYENAYTYAYPVAQKYNLVLNLMISTGLVGNQDFLSWDRIKEMRNSGLVYFTNHTWSHYAVGHGLQEKIQYEIQTAKQQLEQYTGQVINIFTYPYGSFSPDAIQILQQDGFIGGFSTIPGRLQCESYIMTLHRTGIGNSPLSSYGL